MALRLLVVEDNPDWRKIWDFIGDLIEEGTKVTWATSVSEAVTHLQQAEAQRQNFDVIVSDIFLSGGRTGVDFFENVSPRYQKRFLFISSVDPEKIKAHLKSNFSKIRFLQKPFGAQRMVNELREILKNCESLTRKDFNEKSSDQQPR